MSDPMGAVSPPQNRKFVVTSNTDQVNAGIPSWLNFAVTKEEFVEIVKKNFSAKERLALKQQLYAAGYYGQKAWASRSVPEDGQWDAVYEAQENTDTAALLTFLDDVESNTYGNTITSTLNEKTRLELPNLRSITSATLNIDAELLQLQGTAEKLINRRLTDQEQKQIVDSILGFGDSTATKRMPTGNIGADAGAFITGGGADSSALTYGKALARSWGLQPIRGYVSETTNPGQDPAFYKGLAMRVAGAEDYMFAFNEWAQTQVGPDKVFESVRPIYDDSPAPPSVGPQGVQVPEGMEISQGRVPSYIEIKFNEGSVAPQLTDEKFMYQQDSQLQRFIDSVRRPGEWLAYNWDGFGPSQRGAYLINEDVYAEYARNLGIEESDKGVSAQDKIANAYSSDLLKEYGDTDLAAVALRYGRMVADQLKSEGGIEASEDDELKNWVKGVRRSMADWKPRFAPDMEGADYFGSQMAPAMGMGGYGGVIMSDEQFAAASYKEFESRFRTEINANRMMDGIVWLLQNLRN